MKKKAIVSSSGKNEYLCQMYFLCGSLLNMLSKLMQWAFQAVSCKAMLDNCQMLCHDCNLKKGAQ